MDKKHVGLLVQVALVGALTALARVEPAWAPYINIAFPVIAMLSAYLGITSPKAGLPTTVLGATLLYVAGWTATVSTLQACSSSQLRTEDQVIQKAITGEQLGCVGVKMLTHGAARADAFLACGLLQPLTEDAERFVQTLEASMAAKGGDSDPRDGGGG